jgi:hypothetical protein
MNLSGGWFCLIGGIVGMIRVAIAKKFYKSDFANQEGVIAEKDYRTEVQMTPLKQWVIIGVCIVIAVIGVIIITQDHNWNPFSG